MSSPSLPPPRRPGAAARLQPTRAPGRGLAAPGGAEVQGRGRGGGGAEEGAEEQGRRVDLGAARRSGGGSASIRPLASSAPSATMPLLPPFPLRGGLAGERGPLLAVEIWRPPHRRFAFAGRGRRPPAPSLSPARRPGRRAQPPRRRRLPRRDVLPDAASSIDLLTPSPVNLGVEDLEVMVRRSDGLLLRLCLPSLPSQAARERNGRPVMHLLLPPPVGDEDFCVGDASTVYEANRGMPLSFCISLLDAVLICMYRRKRAVLSAVRADLVQLHSIPVPSTVIIFFFFLSFSGKK